MKFIYISRITARTKAERPPLRRAMPSAEGRLYFIESMTRTATEERPATVRILVESDSITVARRISLLTEKKCASQPERIATAAIRTTMPSHESL